MNGDLNKLMDVLGATPTAAAALEIKFGFELAGHNQPSASRLADLRFGNSLAEAHVHRSAPCDDYEKHSQYNALLGVLSTFSEWRNQETWY